MDFGVLKKPIPPVFRPQFGPGNSNNITGYIAPEPNTNYKTRLYLYNQRKVGNFIQDAGRFTDQLKKEYIDVYYANKDLNAMYDNIINQKVQMKLLDRERNLEERRKKLSNLFACEEQKYIEETVATSQELGCNLEKQRQKVKELRAKKEEERLEYVKQVKFRQYLERCTEYRTKLVGARDKETRKIQLKQMEENLSRKESEKELDKFWFDLMTKESKTIEIREKQEMLKQQNVVNESKYFADLQEKEKAVRETKLKEEVLREQKRLDELRVKLNEEAKREQERDRIKKMKVANMFKDQVKEREEIMQKQKDSELKLSRMLDTFAQAEVEKEKERQKEKVSTALKEMDMYNNYLKELAENKAKEEIRNEEILNNNMMQARKKYDDEKCEDERKRKELLKQCTETQKKQMQEKIDEAKRRKENDKMQAEFYAFGRQQNDRLRLVKEQEAQEIKRKYAETLNQQMEYRKFLKKKQEENEQRILRAADEEDRIYNETVENVLSGNIKAISEHHPFYKQVLSEKCLCPKYIY